MASSAIAAASGGPSAVVIEGQTKAGKLNIQASEGGWGRFLDWAQSVYTFTLNWIGSHPFLFIATLVVFGWWRWQAHLTKTEIARLEKDYDAERKRSRLEPPQNRRRSAAETKK